MADPLVVIDRVSYLYPGSPQPVLRDLSFDIRAGEFLGLIGPTGAGKTTLCLALSGIVPQFYGGRFFGSIRVGGLDTVEHPVPELARHVSTVFQDPDTQLIATSVENEIAFALENLGVPRDEIRQRIPSALAAVRLEGSERRHPHELSGGQKQRLAIAAALAVQPALIVLDEPTSQLDPLGEQEVFDVIHDLNRRLGLTVVMASHASEQLAEHADRIALLSAGQLTALGTPDDIYAQIETLARLHLRPPQVAETFQLIGPPAVPPVPVRLAAAWPALAAARQHFRVTAPSLPPPPPPPQGEPLLSVHALTHVYPDGTEALRGVSLDIRRGEYVLIIGQNGAGKTTLVKHFLNLLQPTQGVVTVGGVDTRRLAVSELARRIGYVAQNPDHQIFAATVGDEVAFALRHLRYPPAEVEARTVTSLRQMDLLDRRQAHPLALPKGDRARIVIAALLAIQPEIIILDEPTTGQDYHGAQAILDITRQLHALGQTVLVITHHLYLMPDYAQRVVVMGQGTLLLDAPLREAYHQTDLLQSTYLTPPQAVWLARALSQAEGRPYPLLTPREVAACFACPSPPEAASR